MSSIETLQTPSKQIVNRQQDEPLSHDDGPVWQRLAIYSGSLLLLATGLPLVGIRLFLTPSDPFSAFSHPIQPILQMVHVLSIPIFLTGVGALLVTHAAPHLKQRLNTPSGILILAIVAILTYSGLLLFYVGDELWLQVTLSTHIVSGLAFPIILALHVFLGLRESIREADRRDDPRHTPSHMSTSRHSRR